MGRGQLRLDAITGSYGTGVEDINDQAALIATGSANLSDIAGVFSHLASSIKRIHGHESFSEAPAGVFKQSLQVTGTLSATAGLSGSLTNLADGTSYLIAGSNVTIVTGSNGAVTISSTATGGGGSGDPNASYVVLSSTGSLANERVLTAGEGISVTDSGAGGNVTIALSGLTVTASVYSGYCTGSLQWNSTTWADFHTVPGNFTDSLQNGITRSDSTFTVVSGGLYYFQSDFSYYNFGSYTAWRLSGSNGTIIQQTHFAGGAPDGTGGILTGIFSAVANETFKFQYAWKNSTGYSSTWIPTDPIDGENMRTGVINIFRIADPFKYSSGSEPGGTDTQVQFNDGGTLNGDAGFTYNKTTNALSSSFFVASSGFSGSLTKLTDGTSYLIAGTNVTIVTGSNGAVTISSTATGGGGSGDSYFSSTTAGSIFTTGSAAFRGGESGVDSPADKGSDVFFYVSGSTVGNSNVALFGGDLVTSGALFLQNRTTAPTADASEGVIYSRAGKLYYKEASGVETPFNTGSAVSSTFWNAKVPPTNPHAKDDEFDDGVLAAKWSEFDPPGILTVTENTYGLELNTSNDPAASTSIVGIYQPVPTEDEFEIVAKISISGNTGNFSAVAIFVAGDIVTNPTTAPILTTGVRIAGDGHDIIEALDYPDRTSNPNTLVSIGQRIQTAFLALQWKESTGRACFWYSFSGVDWTRLGASDYDPIYLSSADYFGIYVNGVDQSCKGISEFFRVRSAASGIISTSPLSQGARVNVSTGILSGSGTDNRIVRWNGAQGVQDSGVTIDDSANLSTSGNITGSFVVATTGFSGSLTKLTDGSSYLIAGTNVTITTGSSGAVTISSTATGGGGGDSFFSSTTNGSVFTTGSVAIRGGESAIDSPADKGADVFFYVSGANDDTSSAMFGGSIISSGSQIRLVDTAGTTVAYMDSVGNISGAANIYMGGAFDNVFEGPLNVQGASNTVKFTNNFGNLQGLDWGNGAVTLLHQLEGGVGSGNRVTLTSADLKIDNNNISGSSGLNIVLGSSGLVSTVGDLKVGGGDIQAADGTTAITLVNTTGEVTVAGDLSTAAATFNLANATATTVNFAGGASTALNVGNSAGTNTVSGRTLFSQGLSGSLTQLTDGTSYLIAGTNVTITTGSNGAVTISSTAAGGGGDSYFSSTTNGSVFTTGSAAFRGGESAIDSPADKGTDVFFYVSGSITDGLNRSLFGGHLVSSGSVKAIGGVSGSLTKLTDGTSYIIAGTGATVTTGSSGAVTVGVSPSYITSINWLVG